MEGIVESLWRYPVKSMRGEELDKIFVRESGFEGDRVYGFSSPSLPEKFPWYTARLRSAFVLYRPYFKGGGEDLGGEGEVGEVEVERPDGSRVDVSSPLFHEELVKSFDGELELHCTWKSMVDEMPVSLFSLQSLRRLEEDMGRDLDKRRFRANMYVDWFDRAGFYEDELVGKRIRVGDDVEFLVEEKNLRCKFISIDPSTAEVEPFIFKHVLKERKGYLGIYMKVLREGVVREGAKIEVI
jgi:hypothetical protein